MRPRATKRSLHKSIRRTVVICFALIGLFALISVLVLSQAFFRELSNGSFELAERYFSQIDAFLKSAESTSVRILSDASVQSALQTISRQQTDTAGYAIARKNLQKSVTAASGDVSSFIRYIAVMDRAKQFYSYGGLVTDVALQDQVKAVLRDAPENGSVTWTSVSYGGRQYIVLARTIREIANTSLKPLGQEAIYIDVSAMLKRAELNRSNYMDGTQIFLNGERIFSGSECPEAAASPGALSDHLWEIRKCGADTCLVTCRQFFGGRMVFVNYQKSDRVLGVLGRVVRVNGLILIVVVLAFLLVSLLTIGRQFRKLDRLTEVMRQITPGDYRVALDDDLIAADNEVGLFARQFRDLMDQVDTLVNRDLRNRLFTAQAQYRMLKAQIHPHFLSNTLETIHAMADMDGNDRIARISMSLSKLVRASYSGADYVPLRKEIGFVQEYLTIYRIRFSDRLRAVIDWDESGADRLIPQLTLQPLVENAVRYGLMKKPSAGVIRLKVRCRGDRIRISLFDDGTGFPHALIERYRHMDFENELELHGYTNVMCRLKQAYGDGARFEIHSREGCWTNIGIVIQNTADGEVHAGEARSFDR